MSDAMTETLTPQDAARTIAKARSWEAALEGRTAGLTWMIWGIVSPAIFVTYGFAATLATLAGAQPGWWMGLLWMPWVAMGIVATVALWKTAGLAAPQLDDPREGSPTLAERSATEGRCAETDQHALGGVAVDGARPHRRRASPHANA